MLRKRIGFSAKYVTFYTLFILLTSRVVLESWFANKACGTQVLITQSVIECFIEMCIQQARDLLCSRYIG